MFEDPSVAAQAPAKSPQFSTRLAFVLAAIGGAVGLGNVWKFPYMAGENGGAAFVAIYLLGLAAVAAPIFIAETMIGRRGSASPPRALARQAAEHGRSRRWGVPGLFGLLAGLSVMSFYSVIAGWTIDYMLEAAVGTFGGLTAAGAQSLFGDLQASIPRLLMFQGLFIGMSAAIVASGVQAGIERAVSVMTPALGVLLLILVGYAFAEGDAAAALTYLFAPDFSKLTPQIALAAVGQAFFTLSVGIGGMMMYGAYLPKGASIFRASALVVGADTAVALLAGLAIFPIVFANGLDPAGGPGLIFITLPLAFADLPLGGLLGFLFFFFLVIAALTSAIALYAPTVAWLEERGIARPMGAVIAAGASWLLGLLSVFSFNLWKEAAMTPFAVITWGIDNLVLPIGAVIIAWFAGRVLSRKSAAGELGGEGRAFAAWRLAVRWITPLMVALLFAVNLL